MAESPFFRTLQIGSLRYWGEVCTVIDTKIYTDVILELSSSVFNLVLDAKPFDFVLQNRRFQLQLPGTVQLVYNVETQTWELCK